MCAELLSKRNLARLGCLTLQIVHVCQAKASPNQSVPLQSQQAARSESQPWMHHTSILVQHGLSLTRVLVNHCESNLRILGPLQYAKEMFARVRYLSASCAHLRGSKHLSQRPLGCVHLRASVRRRLISVETSCTARQSGGQAAAVLTPRTASPKPKGSDQMSAAEGCLRFINYAWTQFHAVGE